MYWGQKKQDQLYKNKRDFFRGSFEVMISNICFGVGLFVFLCLFQDVIVRLLLKFIVILWVYLLSGDSSIYFRVVVVGVKRDSVWNVFRIYVQV